MSIANVTINDTFDQWRTKTNQLIVQYEETNTLAVNAYVTTNAASFTAANISANILASNSAFINTIASSIIASGNIANTVLADANLNNSIINAANTQVYNWLSTTTPALIYDQANTARDSANAAYIQANTAVLAASEANTLATTAASDISNVTIRLNSAYNQSNLSAQTVAIIAPKANAALANTTGVVFEGTLTIKNNLNVTQNVSDSKGEVRTIILNDQNATTSTYTLAKTDSGKFISTSANVFIPNTVFTAGEAITIYNNSSSTRNVNTTAAIYLAGTGSTGKRNVAQRGIVTVLCVAANTFVISGAGIT